jgi:hypothetical protein
MKSSAASRIVRMLKEGYLATLRRGDVIPGGYATPDTDSMPYPHGTQPPRPRYTDAAPSREHQQSSVKGAKGGGIRISEEAVPAVAPPCTRDSDNSMRDFRMVYPLIPRRPARRERVYAYADIRWNNKLGELVYYVVEPKITQYDKGIIEDTKRILEERLDIDFFKVGEIKAKSLLRQEI